MRQGKSKYKFFAAIEVLSAEVPELIDLAATYWGDGAPATAAQRLREAADKLDRIKRIRDAWLEGKEEVPE